MKLFPSFAAAAVSEAAALIIPRYAAIRSFNMPMKGYRKSSISQMQHATLALLMGRYGLLVMMPKKNTTYEYDINMPFSIGRV